MFHDRARADRDRRPRRRRLDPLPAREVRAEGRAGRRRRRRGRRRRARRRPAAARPLRVPSEPEARAPASGGPGGGRLLARRRRRRTRSSPCRSGRRCSTRTSGSSPTSRIRARASSSRRAAPAAAATSASPARRGRRRASPRSACPGRRATIELRLKLLADAALVGLPNAGKSSLLARISNARPKVADYPFTTLAPVLGTVEAPDGRQLVVADVPGLIEGASEGVGLGHEFLAHLERARLLLHVIDSSRGRRRRALADDRRGARGVRRRARRAAAGGRAEQDRPAARAAGASTSRTSGSCACFRVSARPAPASTS